ncbi:MAG: paraquat-inducible protein A [Xanthobacteraceae bacterium]|nr:paraquat-inducible protein A [Xanthobacteraceae bacterium]
MTAANSAKGLTRLVGPLSLLNIALFGYVLFQPLLTTRISFFLRNDISLWQAAIDLYRIDKFLFAVVVVMGIVAPAVKMLAMTFAWYFVEASRAPHYLKWLVLLARLSMLDVMLLAILTVAFKGIGIGTVEIKPGFYFYVALVAGFLFLSLIMERMLDRMSRKER